jgi:hypothetical protein
VCSYSWIGTSGVREKEVEDLVTGITREREAKSQRLSGQCGPQWGDMAGDERHRHFGVSDIRSRGKIHLVMRVTKLRERARPRVVDISTHWISEVASASAWYDK